MTKGDVKVIIAALSLVVIIWNLPDPWKIDQLRAGLVQRRARKSLPVPVMESRWGRAVSVVVIVVTERLRRQPCVSREFDGVACSGMMICRRTLILPFGLGDRGVYPTIRL